LLLAAAAITAVAATGVGGSERSSNGYDSDNDDGSYGRDNGSSAGDSGIGNDDVVVSETSSSVENGGEGGGEISEEERQPPRPAQHLPAGGVSARVGRRVYGGAVMLPMGSSEEAAACDGAARVARRAVRIEAATAAEGVTAGSCNCGEVWAASDDDTPVMVAATQGGVLRDDVPPARARLATVCDVRAVAGGGVEHNVEVQAGPDGRWYVSGHTWSGTRHQEDATVGVDGTATVAPRRHKLRLASYNVWNSNPPRWLWRNPVERARMYALRSLALGDVLRTGDADVWALQEVRYDSTLGGHDGDSGDDDDDEVPPPAPDAYATITAQRGASATPYTDAITVAEAWYNRSRTIAALPAWAQRHAGKWDGVMAAAGYNATAADHPHEAPGVEHGNPFTAAVLARAGTPALRAARTALLRHPHAQVAHLAAHLRGYQYVSAPATAYWDGEAWAAGAGIRDEEGPAIFSRLPILASDVILLSRDAGDEGDGHQRAVLHAVLDAGGGRTVDVYTTHLPLSEAARNRTVAEVAAFIRATATGAVQVLAGDMNAEPHEAALAGLVADSGLADAWLARHAEPPPRDTDAALRRYAFTFPSDDPTKRIDLVLAGRVRAAATAAAPCPGDLTVTRVYTLGQDPLPGTESMEGRGLGMVSHRSPIWPSDHRAVVVDARLPPAC